MMDRGILVAEVNSCGAVRFAKKVSAKKMPNRSICQRRFAKSQFAERNNIFWQNFIFLDSKKRQIKIRQIMICQNIVFTMLMLFNDVPCNHRPYWTDGRAKVCRRSEHQATPSREAGVSNLSFFLLNLPNRPVLANRDSVNCRRQIICLQIICWQIALLGKFLVKNY